MRKFNGWLYLSGTIISTSFVRFILLLDDPAYRKLVTLFFYQKLLPVLLIHAIVLIVVNLLFKSKAKACLIFWGLSILAFLAAGGVSRSVVFLLAVVLALITAVLGRALTKLLLPEDASGWGISLGFGILLVSFLSSSIR